MDPRNRAFSTVCWRCAAQNDIRSELSQQWRGAPITEYRLVYTEIYGHNWHSWHLFVWLVHLSSKGCSFCSRLLKKRVGTTNFLLYYLQFIKLRLVSYLAYILISLKLLLEAYWPEISAGFRHGRSWRYFKVEFQKFQEHLVAAIYFRYIFIWISKSSDNNLQEIDWNRFYY